MKWFLLFGALFAFHTAFAQTTSPISRPDVYEKALHLENRIAFKNDGGIFGTGTCWWHSRLQRAFWSLASFEPLLPKPTDWTARELVRSLIKMNQLVVIPGFANVREFTAAYQEMIQKELNRWQMRDSIFKFAWVKGLSGHGALTPESLKAQMDLIYERFLQAKVDQEIVWLMLQESGPIAHSSLLINMKPTENGGYQLKTIDSMESDRFIYYEYKTTDSNITAATRETDDYDPGLYFYSGIFHWVPYLGFESDLGKIDAVLGSEQP